MYDELKAYLSVNTSPQYADVILRAYEELGRIGLSSMDSTLNDIITQTGRLSTDVCLMTIQATLEEGLDYTFLNQGISLNTDELVMKVAVAEGLRLLQNYSDPDGILDVCKSDDDPEGILCELLGMVTEYPPTDYHPIMGKVSHSSINALINLYDTPFSLGLDVSVSKVLLESYRSRIQTWMDKYPNSLASNLVKSRVTIGNTVSYYWDFIPDDILADIEEKPLVAALELSGLLLLSNVPTGNIIMETQLALEHFIGQYEKLEEASGLVPKILQEALK